MKLRNTWAIAAVVAMITTSAFAGTSTYYITGQTYKTGNATGFNGTNYIDGSNNVIASPTLATATNPTVFMQPTMAGPSNPTRHILGGVNTAVQTLQIWANVVDIPADDPEIMGSIGLNVAEVGGVGPNLPSYTSAAYTSAAQTNNAVPAFDGTNILTPPLTDIREVTVPESVLDFGVTGLPPNAPATNSYRIASFTATAGCGQKFDAESQVSLFLQVGNVLIARVADPADPAPGDETVNFGWTAVAGTPDLVAVPGGCTATAAGSCAGAQSATADATLRVVYKGDYAGGVGGVPDGNVDSADNAGFNAAKAAVLANTASQTQKFKGDFGGGVGGVPDGTADSGDNAGFNAQKAFFLAGFNACP